MGAEGAGVLEGALAEGARGGNDGRMTGAAGKRTGRALLQSGRAQQAFWALGDEGRWAVARLLAQERVLTVSVAARRLGLLQQTASRYLQELWKAGLVSREAPADDGRRREFRLTETGAALVQAGMLLGG